MSYSQSNSYNNNLVADDSSTVFDVDTVMPREVPSFPPLPPSPSAVTTTENSNQAISSTSSHESPATTISELLRRINSRHPAMPSREEISTNHQSVPSLSSSSSKRLNNTNQETATATATATTIIESSVHHSMKQPRRSSRLQQLELKLQDQSSAVETPDNSSINVEAVTKNQSFSSSSSSQNTPTTTTKKLTKYDVKWGNKFKKLCAYRRLHGHSNVPQNNSKLGVWVNNQRAQYKKLKANKRAFITDERIEMLESIGFVWERSKWNERFAELSEFKVIHGHTNISMNYSEEYKQLGNWVNKQRTEYNKLKDNKTSQITPERIQMLNSIGFQWSYRSRRS